MTQKLFDVTETFGELFETTTTLVQKKKQKQQEQEDHLLEVKISYNFLFQKYIDKLGKNDRETKRSLKNRKVQLKHLLKVVTGLKTRLLMQEVPKDTAALEKVLDDYSEDYRANKITFGESIFPAGSSGFWNSHLIDKVSTGIEKIMFIIGRIENAADLFVKFIVQELDFKHKRHVDPEGMHFIAAGDAYILGPDGTQNMKLHTNDVYGTSDFVRRPVSIPTLL